MFHALTPDATVHPIYCSEVEAMKLLLADSVRLAITTRQLTRQETAYLNEQEILSCIGKDGDRWFGLDSEQAKYGFINYG